MSNKNKKPEPNIYQKIQLNDTGSPLDFKPDDLDKSKTSDEEE